MVKKVTQAVLKDHRKIGKKFIPPIIDKLGSTFKETSWVKFSVPELIWIALLNYRCGYKEGADLSLSLAKAVKEATGKIEWYAPLSSFSPLTKKQRDKVVEILKREVKLDKLIVGLIPLICLYPQFPLSFIGKTKKPNKEEKEIYLSQMKGVLQNLYDKRSKEATFAQANAIYICFVLGKLQVTSNSSLANFPEIENYPNSEESKKIAASIRASINGFIGLDIAGNMTNWPDYFWNRGLKIDKCE